MDKEGHLFPTALIPFCEFGGRIDVMGVKIEQIKEPVCNSFRPVVIRDQLCYQVDPNEYKDKINLNSELSLSLYLSYNEDRELKDINDTHHQPYVIINTIGNSIIWKKWLSLNFFSEPLNLALDYVYNLNNVKEITTTNSFLSLDKASRKCQEESYDECTTRKYINLLRSKCQCLPFQLKTIDEKVIVKNHI